MQHGTNDLFVVVDIFSVANNCSYDQTGWGIAARLHESLKSEYLTFFDTEYPDVNAQQALEKSSMPIVVHINLIEYVMMIYTEKFFQTATCLNELKSAELHNKPVRLSNINPLTIIADCS